MSTLLRRERTITRMRYLANILVIVGYFMLMNVDMSLGIVVRLFSAALCTPWMAAHKVWDGLGVMGLMTSIDVHQLTVLH